ncbi:ankyrin repeat-containing domain protein [Leucosporidium creatinivorum]|uniref:Ankyrin repeat-containing domain protein n=1 Tax=Leucosporidium creatinivorum TaxID=106004 RepID=A0A1Y2F7L0_9BASI|nr:ankyrin repeat-containing domain protein [Leucosporidium creatinivorum]
MASNIWTAASEGNFARVVELVEGGLSPSVQDENTYTPLHAAASWGHVDILRYLVSKGGDINTLDGDGESPLFVVESAEMARVVIELGGDATLRNLEGVSAAESLAEDYPHVSLYLRSLTGESATSFDPNGPSEAGPAPDLDAPTDELLDRVRVIMEASERGEISGAEVDDRLREVVEQIVNGQVEAGRAIGEGMETDEGAVVRERTDGDAEDGAAKRTRADEAGR